MHGKSTAGEPYYINELEYLYKTRQCSAVQVTVVEVK